MDSVHASWTMASGRSTVDPHDSMDSKLPVLTGGGREREGRCGGSPRGSPELGERRSGRATKVEWRWWWGLMGASSDVRGEERMAVSNTVEDRVTALL
jgi:hypothetical protein